MKINWELKSDGNARTLVISGRLDTMSARELEEGVKPLLDDEWSKLTIATDGLMYISSTGLRCFVQLFNAAKSRGAEFAISGIQPPIKEILDLTGFSKVFGI